MKSTAVPYDPLVRTTPHGNIRPRRQDGRDAQRRLSDDRTTYGQDDATNVPDEAQQAVSVLRRRFGESLVAVYLHGSAVAGGLRPSSDVDLLAIVERPTTPADRADLAAALLEISGRHPAAPGARRPVELIVFLRAHLAAPACPARAEFVYGEWLRDAVEAGDIPAPGSDPELTLLLAQARRAATPLIGPDPAELLPIVPGADIRRAITDALPPLLDTLEGDARNVLLTLVRMWRTLATGEFVPKDEAAAWASPRLSGQSAELVDEARRVYLGVEIENWQARHQAVRRAANDLGARVAAML